MGLVINPTTGKLDVVNTPGAASDEKVKVSLNDALAGYLNGKLVAGTGITLTENNDGGNETLEIAATSTPTSPGGSNLQVQFNNAGVFGGLDGSSVDDALQRLGIQVALPLNPLHVAGVVGQTVAAPASGSISLVAEISASAPSGTITQIAELAAPSSGSIGFIDAGSGSFYADNSTYTYRIYPLLLADGSYYASSNYIELQSTDPNDGQYYNISLDWTDVVVGSESIYYLVTRDVNGSGFSDYAQVAVSDYIDYGSPSGASYTTWPSYYQNAGGTPPSAPSSFDYATQQYDGSSSYYYASGQNIIYEIDQYKNILGTDYVSGSPVSYNFTDDMSGNWYYVDLGWTFGGADYDGIILRKSFDGGSTWVYQKLDAGSYPGYFSDYNYSDDGNGFIWGNTYGGGGAINYAFDPYGRGISPSGNAFYSTVGTPYNTSIPADSVKYILKHNLSGIPAGGAKIIAPSGAGTNGKVVSASFYDLGYPTWGDGTAITPTGYGFTGTTQNRDYRVYAYQTISGQNIYSSTYLTLSTTATGGAQSVSASFAAVAGATGYKIFRQVNGGGFSALTKVTAGLTFTDDTTDGGWGNNNTLTPTNAVAEVVRIDRETTSVTDAAHLGLVSTGSGTRYASLAFGIANNSASNPTYQAYIQLNSSGTAYLDIVTPRVSIPSSRGGTAAVILGNANVFNNGSSSTVHFQVKGQNDAYLINTRSDYDTVFFGQQGVSDPSATIRVQPNRSGDKGIILRGHSGHSTTSVLLLTESSAGSFGGQITVGGHFQAGQGSVSVVGLGFRADTDTGLYNATTNVLGIVTAGTERIRIDANGRVGINLTSMTAKLHIAAGSTSANTAPLKLTSGSLMTTPEPGAIEFLTDRLYYTRTTSSTRLFIAASTAAPVSTRVAYADANGFYQDTANFTYVTNRLSPTYLTLAAGTAAAGTAPLIFTSGTLLTVAVAGAQEFLTDKYYGTITTGAARKEFTLNDIALTTGRIPFTTTNGRLTDSSNLQFASSTLTFGEAINLAVGTTTGTKIGTATTQKLGFWNATPVVQNTGWTMTNVTSDKVLDADATSINELADVVATLIDTLKSYGILGA
jgi:hypothetical protein